MGYPDGTTVSFEYNERNQLARIPGFFEGPVAEIWTDNAGFRYDANGPSPHRPHSSHIRRDALATPSSYQHDAYGRRVKIVEGDRTTIIL